MKKTFADTEKVMKNLLETKVEFTEATEIKCAHRVGQKTYKGHHPAKASKSEEHGPMPIIAKITSWKMKEGVLQEARSKRSQGVMFLNDFLKNTLERKTGT